MSRKGTTKAHGQKHDLDKFYTKREVAAECLRRLKLSEYGRIIEPSAGGGAFSDHLLADQSLSTVLALDLLPENDSITQMDWFDFQETSEARTLVVGNPPFGQQCSLAVRFINHAFDVVGADTVAFILPRSFRKASVQNRVYRNARLAKEVILGPNSFELEGADYDLPAVFQVWQRTKRPRKIVLPPTTSPYFSFTKKDEVHDFAIRRVGGRAGLAFIDTGATSEQSNYFIKLTVETSVAEMLDLVNSLDFSVADDGTGPRTLSKRELVAIFDAGYAASRPATAA